MDIELNNIGKSFKGRTILDSLCLKVHRGDFHVLLGPSGAGKTTLLSIIAGVVKQDQGDVLMGGCNVNGLAPEKRNIGIAYQNYALFPHLTVFENIAYGLWVRKIEKDRIAEKVGHYLAEMQINSEKEKYPHQLSGGQKQRVALARALVTEPGILLLDEPMSSLDPLTKEKTGNELKRLQQQSGMTTLYVTHNQEEAALLGNRVSVIHNGKIEQAEAPAELFDHPKTEFVAHFVGVNNVLEVSFGDTDHHGAVGWIDQEGLDQPVKIRAKKYPIIERKRNNVKLCIHPEKIMLRSLEETGEPLGNELEGKITSIAGNGTLIRTTVDIGGVLLQAAVPNHLFRFNVNEKVRVCFTAEALHPLCGKRSRSPMPLRQCCV